MKAREWAKRIEEEVASLDAEMVHVTNKAEADLAALAAAKQRFEALLQEHRQTADETD